MQGREMDELKLFVGGIARNTKEDTLRDYFSRYGDVTQAVIMMDKSTGHSRGFGFVAFSDPSILDVAVRERHAIDGRKVEVKRALSREGKRNLKSGDSDANRSRNFSGPGSHNTKKIFVGGLPVTLTVVEFERYFQNYGDIDDVVIMFDQITCRSRGFGFITFVTEDAVDRVLEKTFHELGNKLVEVKRARPREANPSSGARGRNLNSYGSHGANSHSFGRQMESRKNLQLQPATGGYPPYSGYEAPSYGYGLANNGAFYGSYGFGGYGSFNAGYAGYAGSALAYGDHTAANTNFLNSYAGLKKAWSSHIHGPGALLYSVNAGYGATVPWGTALSGNSGSGIRRSGNQGYQHR